MRATECEGCGFPCEPRRVDDTWSFLCALCAFIEDADLERRIATSTRTESAEGYASEKMSAFNATIERMRALCADLERNTARVLASIPRA